MGKFTLNKTGQQINNILDKAVLTEGNQTISGVKTFENNINLGGDIAKQFGPLNIQAPGINIVADEFETNDISLAAGGKISLSSGDSTIEDAVSTINSKADDSSVVHKTNVEETIYGNKTFRNDTTFEGPTVVKNVNLATFKVQDTAGEHIIYMGTNASNSWISVTDGISEPEHSSTTIGSSSITIDKVTDDALTDISRLNDSKLEFQSDFDEEGEPQLVCRYGRRAFNIISDDDDLLYVGIDSSSKGHLNSMNDLTIVSNEGSTYINSSGGTTIDSSSNTKIIGTEGVIIGQYASASSYDSLYPGNYYDYGTITEPLVVQLWSADNGLYEFEFTTPTSGDIPLISFPENLKWENASTPSLQNNFTYVITIRHGLASYKKFAEPR